MPANVVPLHTSPRPKLARFNERAAMRIKSLRRALGYSFERLAFEASIGVRNLKRYEKNQARIPADFLLWLVEHAERRGVSVAEVQEAA